MRRIVCRRVKEVITWKGRDNNSSLSNEKKQTHWKIHLADTERKKWELKPKRVNFTLVEGRKENNTSTENCLCGKDISWGENSRRATRRNRWWKWLMHNLLPLGFHPENMNAFTRCSCSLSARMFYSDVCNWCLISALLINVDDSFDYYKDLQVKAEPFSYCGYSSDPSSYSLPLSLTTSNKVFQRTAVKHKPLEIAKTGKLWSCSIGAR